jgi:hypothetical protein
MPTWLQNLRHFYIAGLGLESTLIAIISTRMATRMLSSTFLNTLVVCVTSFVFFSCNIGMTEVLTLMTTF